MSLETTKADEIALVLEEAIVSGELEPGQVLRQEEVSERFDVSRTPVREALRRLAALGLVSFIPNRGVRVRTITAQELREAFLVRAELESLATEIFDSVLGEEPNQVGRLRDDVQISAAELLSIPETPGEVTDDGLATNVRVGIGYLDAWLRGVGAAAIDNLMEDVATAEISRSQLWQWVRHGRVSRERVLEEIAGTDAPEDAKDVFTEVTLADDFVDFLTIPAYERL